MPFGWVSLLAFLALIICVLASGLSSDRTIERPLGTAATCAEALGIHWDAEDGATERLDAFEACVQGRVRP